MTERSVRRMLAVSLMAAMALVALVLPPDSWAIEVNDRAPLFTTKTLNGESFSLKEHLGKKTVLLNFWSVFCRDCIQRIEAFNKIQDLYQRRDFVLVGIAGDPPTPRMLTQVKKYAAKMHFPVILDPELDIYQSYDVEIIPYVVLVGKDGNVIAVIDALEPEQIKALSDAIDKATR